MSLVMRLRQQGRKNRRTYRIVVTDRRAPRDGKYIESVGFYDPELQDNIVVHKEKIEHWFNHGVKPSENMVAILKRVCPDALKILQKKKAKKV